MKAVIMAGGEGNRLRPLTCTFPKPKAPLLGVPVLYHVLDSLCLLGVSGIILTLRYKASDIVSMFPDGEYKGIPVSYVIEEEPLGTAGSVKNAVGEPMETVLVLSGDAYFDFDLEKCADYHQSEGNDVTIVTKTMDDPREYGIVNSENGIVSGFTEKPGWGGAFTDTVNTGIYFCEPSAISMIPDNTASDFAKDLFPELLKSKHKVGSFAYSDYWCDIGDIESYRQAQFDIIGGKTDTRPSRVAEGVFTSAEMPAGDFIIIPPVYFGKNVQVEAGAVIGPNAVIGDGCLISKGAKIRESVLLENVYVSSAGSVNGAVLCEGVSVKRGGAVFENSAVGSESIIGEDAVVTNNVLIWPKKTIENGALVTENIKYSGVHESAVPVNSIICGDFGVELTPEKAARFGAALGTLSRGIRVGVGIDGEVNATALKCGILGGLISAGAKSFDFGKCFNSQMFYYSSFCELDIAVFIGGGENGASITMHECGGIAVSREYSRELELILKYNEFNRCSGGDCQSVSVMNSMDQMYLNELARQFGQSQPKVGVSLFSGNKMISECFSLAMNRLGINQDADGLIIKIDDTGTHLSVIENSISFTHEKILALIAYNELMSGNDIVLPWEAPQIITALAQSVGRKVYRYSDSGISGDDGEQIRMRGIKQLWSRDALFLAIRLLGVISEKNSTVAALSHELPEFYVAKKIVEIDVSPAMISKKLAEFDFKKHEVEGLIYETERGNAKLKSDSDGKTLRIIAEAVNAEAAQELCGEIESLINAAAIDNISKK